MDKLSRNRLAGARPALGPALGAYLVVGLFAAAYGIIKLIWPHTSSTFAVASAVLLAAPVALGLLWPRLGGFKAFGFEVTLSQVTVRTNPELVSAITAQQYFSGLGHLIDQLKNTIARPETEVIEVDLRDGSYWWPTRLYLLATLVDEFSTIATLVFVDGGPERRFVGMADPSAVRRALATNFPVLEAVYRGTIASVAQQPRSVPDRIVEIVNGWPLQYPGVAGATNAPTEMELPRVSRILLNEWLEKAGKHLIRDSVSWSGITDPALYRSLVLDYRSRYVALLRDGRLDRLVNRLQLAVQLVETAK
jgi:hypothetical protein